MKAISASLLLLPLTLTAADPTIAEAKSTMKKAAHFFREKLSVDGGYASEWQLDPVIGYTEHHEGPTVFSIQPHGTTTIGLALLEAYRATGDSYYLNGAIESGMILTRCQLSTGGWRDDFDFSEKELIEKTLLRTDLDEAKPGKRKRPRPSTLDDNKSQSALLLLLELSAENDFDGKEKIEKSLQFGFDALLAAQHPDGSWPQQFEAPSDPGEPVLKASIPEDWPRSWPDEKYYRFATLNDGNLLNVAKLLIRAHEITSEDRYLQSGKRLGDFFLRAQLPEPQAGWAQQYNEKRHPVWARKFEPPSVASVETWNTIEALFELWIATGDPRYRSAIPPALEWLESSRLPDGGWARFYELRENRPLYFVKDTYELTYNDSNLPTHYGFQLGDSFSYKIDRMREYLDRSREEWLSKRFAEKTPERLAKNARSLTGKVADAIKSQHPDGYWIEGDHVDAGAFVKRMNALSGYVLGLSAE